MAAPPGGVSFMQGNDVEVRVGALNVPLTFS
jgi:hypothetical protein